MPAETLTNRRRNVIAILTDMTCGEPCWHAKEETCRCSCGGENHGCLLEDGVERPVRMCKISGMAYELAGVGSRDSLINEANWINRAYEPSSTDPVKDHEGKIHRYHYSYNEAQDGSPARLKAATPPQFKWSELASWLDKTERPYLLWKRVKMPTPQYCQDGGCEKCNKLKADRLAVQTSASA